MGDKATSWLEVEVWLRKEIASLPARQRRREVVDMKAQIAVDAMETVDFLLQEMLARIRGICR